MDKIKYTVVHDANTGKLVVSENAKVVVEVWSKGVKDDILLDIAAAIEAWRGGSAQVTHCPICKADPCICVKDEDEFVPPSPSQPWSPKSATITGFPGVGRSMDIPSLRSTDDDLDMQLDIALDAVRDFFVSLIGELRKRK